MKSLRWFGAVVLAAVAVTPAVYAQQPPAPGPEHDVLKKWVGDWTTAINAGGQESKGTATYRMELNGLWLASTFKGELGGMSFQGRGMDTYDPAKKKYVAVWCDSMSAVPMMLEGTYDKDKKTYTMSGEGPGMDGKPTKFREVVQWKDDDHFHFSMYMADGKDPMLTVAYTRKK
ncbi:MAG TPA: DUF1579 domain-containing protein [Fimbriiglobus sp.]|jgi:hypothetical protein